MPCNHFVRGAQSSESSGPQSSESSGPQSSKSSPSTTSESAGAPPLEKWTGSLFQEGMRRQTRTAAVAPRVSRRAASRPTIRPFSCRSVTPSRRGIMDSWRGHDGIVHGGRATARHEWQRLRPGPPGPVDPGTAADPTAAPGHPPRTRTPGPARGRAPSLGRPSRADPLLRRTPHSPGRPWGGDSRQEKRAGRTWPAGEKRESRAETL